MSRLTFSTQTGKSYYCNTIAGFLSEQSTTILGELTKYGAKYGFDTTIEQTDAWESQIIELQLKLKEAGCEGDIIFEYDIVRMGKRIDVVLLIKHMVFSLEFKNGAKKYMARDAEQAEDYALNLKNFHKESENLYVCPILVATEAEDRVNLIKAYPDKQVYLQYANNSNLMDCIRAVYDAYGDDEQKIDLIKWYNSSYCPTPTIIEAAVTAYREHTVEKIAHSEAGQDDVDKCESAISQIIDYARSNGKKCICFVTGVPGAGKTLVGLDIASKYLNFESDSKSVYLSGNGPLVKVLRKALSNNAKERKKAEKKVALSKEETQEINTAVSMFIQEAYNFRKDNARNPKTEPTENVIIFDEAQRCWDKSKLTDWSKKKMGQDLNASEPEYFISVMNRRSDWAVIICLVGLGQDIYDGEVGINEWFRSSINDFDDWEIYYSSKIFDQIEDKNIDRKLIEASSRSHIVDELHLNTSIRSFRSDKQSAFVDALLNNEPEKAKIIYNEIIDQYPIYVTRDINLAKKETTKKVRGSQRSGIIASSSAKRLRPYGIILQVNDFDEEKWFLAPKEDLRSSNSLEVVASEFKIQGLEIDHSLMCWDADLRRVNNDWDYYNFSGTSWKKRRNPAQKRYLLNAYRVLLTRGRQSLIIFVPHGDETGMDETRKPEFYDSIYNYLVKECGIKELTKDNR